jgi:hypothetical protein
MKGLVLAAAVIGAVFAFSFGGMVTFSDEFAARYVRILLDYRVVQRVGGPLAMLAGAFMAVMAWFVASHWS